MIIGKIAATEKKPTTIDEFYFWTAHDLILSPFDIVKVSHINGSSTFGVIEEISHITDSSSYISNYISNDFGDTAAPANTERIGMNYVKAKVVGNDQSLYLPVKNGSEVYYATQTEIEKALGLDEVENPIVCGYLEMYERAEDEKVKVTLPVKLNSNFLLGPEGAHLNISGISGLAAKTSYAMFLLKSIQHRCLTDKNYDDDVAFVLLNVKGKDLLAIDEKEKYNKNDLKSLEEKYLSMGLDTDPFKKVKYFYPYSSGKISNSYADEAHVEKQLQVNKAFKYKYIYEDDKDNIDLMFSNIDDPNQTIDSIINYIITGQGNFSKIRNWDGFISEIDNYCQAGSAKNDKEITVASWRRFKRIIKKSITSNKQIFSRRIAPENKEVRLRNSLKNIQKNDVYVVDIAKLDESMQSFVFGDVIRAVYDLQLGQFDDVDDSKTPSKIVIFIDELNKYASSDAPKNSPIMRQILDISERGRSLGIVLFSAEQFKSAIHDRVKGNCSTHAYGRTNAIEISKSDYRYIPTVYKNIMTRLKQGEYIIQNPIFRSLLNVKFPKPLYNQFKKRNLS